MIPAEAQERVRKGNILFDKESYAEAQKEYEAAIRFAKNWYEPHYELGQAYSRSSSVQTMPATNMKPR